MDGYFLFLGMRTQREVFHIVPNDNLSPVHTGIIIEAIPISPLSFLLYVHFSKGDDEIGFFDSLNMGSH